MQPIRVMLVLVAIGFAAVSRGEESAAPGSVEAAPPAAPASVEGAPPAAPEGNGAGPREVVESLHGVLLSCMREADALGFQGRYERIAAELDESFDLPFMARVSVGDAWNGLGEQQRDDFIELSRRYSASKYADNFDGYSGQTFETRSEEAAGRGTVVVKTELVQPEDRDVALDYRLRQTPDGWRIIDVQLDGKVSELTLRRSDYRAVIERQGFGQLVAAIEEKIRELSLE
jgi:phospholipid transport system substrate-binding protein